jgi:hypothetical protein
VVIKVKPNINSVGVHPQLSNNRHPVDGALVGAAGSLYMAVRSFIHKLVSQPFKPKFKLIIKHP